MICSVEDCNKPVKARKLCCKHYKRWSTHGDVNKVLCDKNPNSVCSILGCGKPTVSKGFCNMHYMRSRSLGGLSADKAAPFSFKSENGTGYITSHGYRRFTIAPDVYEYEHIRVAEAALGKKLPEGAEVHHLNKNKADNRPTNLVVCPDHAYHMLLHKRARDLGLAEYFKAVKS